MSHRSTKHQKQGKGTQTGKPKHPILRIFVAIAGTGIASSASYGFFKFVGVKDPLDKFFVIIFAVSVVVYYGLDIKDKFTKWDL